MPPKKDKRRRGAKSSRPSSSQRGQQAKAVPNDAAADAKVDAKADDDRDSVAESSTSDAGGKGIISILSNRNRS